MTQIQQDIKAYLLEQGATDDGFCCPPDGAFGGHLKSAVVGATAEVFITVLSGKIDRTFDEQTGLNLMTW